MIYLRYNFRKGFMGYTRKAVTKLGKAGSNVVVYDNGVYDMSTYITNNGSAPSTPLCAFKPLILPFRTAQRRN